MISDPFINNTQSNIENLALNRANLDIATLIEYLKSQEFSLKLQKKIIFLQIALVTE